MPIILQIVRDEQISGLIKTRLKRNSDDATREETGVYITPLPAR
jgi:hypothetical protein